MHVLKLITRLLRNAAHHDISIDWTSCDHWLLATKQVHQEHHCRCTNRIWLQRECTRKYYCLILHDRDWILSVI